MSLVNLDGDESLLMGRRSREGFARKHPRLAVRHAARMEKGRERFESMTPLQRRAVWLRATPHQRARIRAHYGPRLSAMMHGEDDYTMGAAKKRKGYKPKTKLGKALQKRMKSHENIFVFVKNFKKMTKPQRKAYWAKIPKPRKAALLLLAGPILLPLILAAGVAVTATAAAAPFAMVAIGKRLKARKAKAAAARKRAQTARQVAVAAASKGDTATATKATAQAVDAEAEAQTEETAIAAEEKSIDNAAEVASGESKGNLGAAIPLAAVGALMLLG